MSVADYLVQLDDQEVQKLASKIEQEHASPSLAAQAADESSDPSELASD